MKFKVKNPVYLFLLNWIILLIGYMGVHLLPLINVAEITQYILSFIVMNFYFLGTYSKPIVFLICWLITIGIFGIFVKSDWKIPILGIVTEGIIYIFSIVLLKRHSEESYFLMRNDLFMGFAVTSTIILLLYVPIVIRSFFDKRKKNNANYIKPSLYILKCPHCGQKFESNPIICYSCSKKISSS